MRINPPLLFLFYHKDNGVVVRNYLLLMRAKVLSQDMEQRVLGLQKIEVELLLLFER
jgi:hypothetical protein